MKHRNIGILLSMGLQKLFRDDLGHLPTPSWAVLTPLPKEGRKSVDPLSTSPFLQPFSLALQAAVRMTPKGWTPHMSSNPKALGLTWDQMDSFHRP